MKKLGLAIAIAVAIAIPTAAAAHAYSVPGLKISPPVGAFGSVAVGSCNLTTYAGCELKTFTIQNVGSSTILIGGFGIATLDPLTAATVPGRPGSGCEFLPLSGSVWALAPGASCEITTALAPLQKGVVRNELHIWSGDQSSPIAVIPLLGVGT
jgi:hypothetical protein